VTARTRARHLLPALIASAVLVALLVTVTGLRPQRVAGTLRALDLAWCGLALLVYGASYVARGARLAVLLPRTSSVLHFTSISARHTFFAVVMPFRSGEAALPLLLATEAGRPLPEGVSVLGVMRALDLLAVALYLLLGLALFSGGATADTGPRALVVLAALLVALVLMRPVCARLSVFAGAEGGLRRFLGRAAQHVAGLRTGQLLLAILASLVAWLCTYAACFFVLRAMVPAPEVGPLVAPITFAQSLVGTTGLHLSAVIPVSPVAGIGTWEAGWTAGYALTGLDLQTAGTTAVVSHVVIFAFIVLIGALGHATRRLGRPVLPGVADVLTGGHAE